MPKRFEFSKVIIIGVLAVTFAVTVFTCVMVWRTGDLAPLSVLIPALFAESAAATACYYGKAWQENKVKLPHYLAASKDISGEEVTK